jgi:thioredoxin-related protein
MISRLIFIVMCSLAMGQVHALTEGSLDAGMVNPGYHEHPEWFKNSFLDINEDIADAKKHDRRLVLFFYQDGCPYCKKLFEDNLGQKAIAEKMRQHFDVVAINIWGDRDVTVSGQVLSEKDFAAQLKVMYTPTLIFFNEAGKAALRANGYYPPEKFDVALDYALGNQDAKESFSEYLARISPRPAAGKLHRDVETSSAPYAFNKPLTPGKSYRLVMFEQKQCKPCDELHQDILQRAESRKLLQHFDVSVLDNWSDDKLIALDGKTVKTRDFAQQQNIQYAPSLVFFDKSGKRVFSVDAYLKAFHIQSAMDYVASGEYLKQPNFQRYIEARADALRSQGVEVDIMK